MLRAVDSGIVVALCGGIGGAKLALGLSRILTPERLAIVVNTGDDFRHFGLHISPDIDTVIYTLSGRNNPETGWGRAEESWRFMQAVAELGAETWFQLGDTDLATSAVRTQLLQGGQRLTEITARQARALGVAAAVLPASDDSIATIIDTDEGAMSFQHYFVRRRCEPRVTGVRFEGTIEARVSPEARQLLTSGDLAAVVICPSNPYLSINPMLAIQDFRALLGSAAAPIVAVTPIVGGNSVKGPLAKMMAELGCEVSPRTVADEYRNFLDAMIIDEQDANAIISGMAVHKAATIMTSLEDRIALARFTLDVASVTTKRARA